MNTKKLKELQSKNKLNAIEIAIINTLIYASRYLASYTLKFNASTLPKNWKTFVAWMQTALPDDTKFELLDEKHLIFKGAVEGDALSTNSSDLLTKTD